jgi:hypothetical protein
VFIKTPEIPQTTVSLPPVLTASVSIRARATITTLYAGCAQQSEYAQSQTLPPRRIDFSGAAPGILCERAFCDVATR